FKVRITMQTLQTGGTIVWQEEHTVTTNQAGLFSIVVGNGMPAGGFTAFKDIEWNNQSIYLKTEVNYPSSWTVMGAAKIWSVPYSLIADKAIVADRANSITTGSKLEVVSQNDALAEALFVVRRKDGQPVFLVYPDSVRIWVPNSTTVKGSKGGFAIGGFNEAKSSPQELFRVTPDSVRIYLDPTPSTTKGSKGGFAIGGYTEAKGSASKMYFNLSPSSTINTVMGSPQVLWYPQRNAFLAGNVRIASVDSVGDYSTALGYWSRAAGDYSQAFGYKTFADGDYSTAIGKRSVAGSDTAKNAFAFGDMAKAIGMNSIAFGSNTQARVTNALALGNGSIASGKNSTALGYQSQSQGDRSIAIGSYYTTTYSVPILRAVITAPTTADDAFLPLRSTTTYTTFTRTFNRANIAQGKYSIAVGNGNLAQNGGFVLGTNSDAIQFGALGLGTAVHANNKHSVAIGYEAKAAGIYSVAMGNNVMANSFGEFALGQYGDSIVGTADTWNQSEQLFSIGNGTSPKDRSNAMTVYKNGKTIIRGRYAYSTFNNQSYRIVRLLYPYSLTFNDYVYGIYTNLNRDDSNIEYYYSGYFASTGTAGTYKGLYADLINTPSLNATVINGVTADVAEHIYDTNNNTEPADVVVADPQNKISAVKSSKPYQTSVIGVVSTKPMLTMGNELIIDEVTGDQLKNPKPTARLALTGRVPVKISGENGNIQPGDFLTTSSIAGTAMKWTLLDVNEAKDFDDLKRILSENEKRRNAIIGKAIEKFDGTGTGKIMMLISLQ
ncbi:MAG TPA: hypothetical protein VHO68_12885, partial [Bacteroidales bacterium]|nr:hypothetical protein [Bacteroidales bacterium]